MYRRLGGCRLRCTHDRGAAVADLKRKFPHLETKIPQLVETMVRWDMDKDFPDLLDEAGRVNYAMTEWVTLIRGINPPWPEEEMRGAPYNFLPRGWRKNQRQGVADMPFGAVYCRRIQCLDYGTLSSAICRMFGESCEKCRVSPALRFGKLCSECELWSSDDAWTALLPKMIRKLKREIRAAA